MKYDLIIKGLSEVSVMQHFVQVGQGPSDADEYEQDEQLNLSSSVDSISDNQSNPTSFQSSDHIGNEECSATITENQGSFGNIGSTCSSEEKALLNMSASNNKQGAQLETESESEDDKSDITVILAETKKEKQAPTQPAEQADSITRESTQPKPVTSEQDISAKDNSKSKPKENNVTSQNKKMYILVTSALVVAAISGIAIGVCCLIAIAVVIYYYYNSPSNSLENSNTEVAMNQGQGNCKAG